MKRLFAIISCHKNRQRRDDCRATWVKDIGELADYVFFIGNGPDTDEKDVVKLDVADSYNDLPIKIIEVCKWALAHGYDYMLKVDDDTYVWPKRIVQNVEPNDYVGRHNLTSAAHCRKGFCSGLAYWLSKKAMEVMTWGKPDILWEDQWAGGWLFKNGILATNDKRYVIGNMLPRTMWEGFMQTSACFAEMGLNGDMQALHDMVKGKLHIPEPLPATGRAVRLAEPKPVGQIIRAGSRLTGMAKPKVTDPRTGRVFYGPEDVHPRRKR